MAAALYHAAKDAKPLLERYEALTCEGAARYGLKCGEFIGLVRSYAGVPQRELEEVERDLGIYRFAVPHLAEEGGGLYLTDGFKARLVTAGGFEEKAEEILKALERGSFS